MDSSADAAISRLLTDPVLNAARECARGGSCHIVGGLLRDLLLGRDRRGDIDLVVAGRGREIADRLAQRLRARLVPLGGREFAAFRLVVGSADPVLEDKPGLVIDLWDRESNTLEADLARRDFTINSIALDLSSGELVDPFDGREDLQRRLLRATTVNSFRADPLRVLRLPRFEVELPAFGIAPMTLRLACASAGALGTIAAERIRDELERIFAGESADRGISTMIRTGVYPGLFLGAKIPSPQRASLDVVPRALRLLAKIVLELERSLEGLSADLAQEIDLPIARLAITFLFLPGDPPREHLARLRRSRFWTRDTIAALDRFLSRVDLPVDVPELRRFLHHHGDRWSAALAVIGALAGSGEERAQWQHRANWAIDLVRSEGKTILRPPVLLDGEDIQRLLAIEAGPDVGRALAALREAQVQGTVIDRREAIAFVTALSADEA